MIHTKYYRRINTKGDVNIPSEVRERLSLYVNDEIALTTTESSIVIHKSTSSCCFCGSTEDLRIFKGKQICLGCISDL